MKNLKKISEEIQNVQIYPATTRVEPNDKLTKLTFNFNAETFEALRTGAEFDLVEVKNHKKFSEIVSSFKLESNLINPLNEFDRDVFNVCNSEFNAGNCYTTPSIICRGLTGKVGRGTAEPSKNQYEWIIQSVDRLMRTVYDPQIAEAFEKLDYGDDIVVKKSMLLPCCRVNVTINGKQTEDVIYFDRESPLMTIAKIKNQIIRYDASLLDILNQNNTPLVIMLKNYVVRRIFEVIAHKMTPTLTFADIFKKCRISGRDKHANLDARNTVKSVFEHLKEKGVIKDFSVVKRGNQIHGISFIY